MQKTENIYELAVCTPEGEKCLCVKHWDDRREVGLITEIEGRSLQLKGESTEYLLYRLAQLLPAGWEIKSCLSCRHGNFCPVGDQDNELFCVNDFEPKQKSDLFEVTEDFEQRDKRSRNLFHVCGQYISQSEEYYTYSTYLYAVRKAGYVPAVCQVNLDEVQQPARKEERGKI